LTVDIRNEKNLTIYLEQLKEVKSRLNYVSNYENKEEDQFITESYALHIRKLIELLAFSLVAVNKSKYMLYRSNVDRDYTKDWNGRDIISNVLALNPDLFFKPCKNVHSLENSGVKQIQLRTEKDCYSLKRLGKLYDRCGGVLHVENPWRNSNRIRQFHVELPTIAEKLKRTLQDHVLLMNHWDQGQSSALIFTLGYLDEKPTYALAVGDGNFAPPSA